jgi:uncharacterized membrane protein YecN with MAPEG domain
MAPTIVPAYAAALALIYIFLALRVIRSRQTARVAIGTGGNAALARAIRVHGNFAEYVPLVLLLLAFLEMQGWPPWWVHALCLSLVAARLVHAYGVSQEKENFQFRTVGMATTFFVLATSSLALLGGALRLIG